MMERHVDPWVTPKALAMYEFLQIPMERTPEEMIFEGWEFNMVENLLHEVAHALSLGITLRPPLSLEVSAALEGMEESRQVGNEAYAWAIEYHAASQLGMDLSLGEVYDQAQVQGCADAQVRMYVSCHRSKELADQLVEILKAYRGEEDEMPIVPEGEGSHGAEVLESPTSLPGML